MTEPEPSDIEIRYRGQPAISPPLAAKRYRLGTDTMRKTLGRLRAAGAVEPFPEGLDERTELYPLGDLDAAMADRPGKGANLKQREARPMVELTDKQQPAYIAAAEQFAPYSWPDETKERAAREIAGGLWDHREQYGGARLQQLAEDDAAWRTTVEAFVTSLRHQGAQVTPIPIGRAVRAVAALLGE